MKLVLYTNSISAHQIPLAYEIVAKIGEKNFRYIYTNCSLQGGNQEIQCDISWIVKEENNGVTRNWLETCDVLLVGGLRPIELLERRSARGLITFYQSERWFKPIQLNLSFLASFCAYCPWGGHIYLPGYLRMLVPGYRRMSGRFVHLMNNDPKFVTLPIGPWAKQDFLRLGVHIDKMVDWGYFVSKSTTDIINNSNAKGENHIRLLWVGRLLDWKCVDSIIRAIAYSNKLFSSGREESNRFSLTIVGDGPEKERLIKLAQRMENHLSYKCFDFLSSIPISQVRSLMRSHDVYVLSSNSYEGWGAVVNEALSENMTVLGTYEAGASASLLPPQNLFHAEDWKHLAEILIEEHYIPIKLPDDYTPYGAATKLFNLLQKINA